MMVRDPSSLLCMESPHQKVSSRVFKSKQPFNTKKCSVRISNIFLEVLTAWTVLTPSHPVAHLEPLGPPVFLNFIPLEVITRQV